MEKIIKDLFSEPRKIAYKNGEYYYLYNETSTNMIKKAEMGQKPSQYCQIIEISKHKIDDNVRILTREEHVEFVIKYLNERNVLSEHKNKPTDKLYELLEEECANYKKIHTTLKSNNPGEELLMDLASRHIVTMECIFKLIKINYAKSIVKNTNAKPIVITTIEDIDHIIKEWS